MALCGCSAGVVPPGVAATVVTVVEPDVEPASAVEGTASRPEQAAIAGEATKRASETLQAMPNKQRTAFLLRNDQGLSIADVAKVMKTTEGTVRVYLHRAVAALRQSLVEFV